MIENALYSILTGDTDITAIVSLRIYPEFAPQGTALPYIVYHRLDTRHIEVLAGSHGLAWATMTIESFSATYLEARDIAEKVRLALQGQQGTHATVSVEGVSLTSDRDRGITPQNADDPGTFSVEQDFEMGFTEAIPA